MKIALIIIGIVVVLIVAFGVWRYFATVIGGLRRDQALVAEIQPIIMAIREGGEVPMDQIARLAERTDTRSALYRALHEIDRSDLFPEQYRELKQIAESDLVVWLLHQNELGAKPDEIELARVIEKVEGDPIEEKYRFFVFKFRTHPPHWAAKDGWMAGVAGPYCDGEDPLQSPPGVFSRFEAFDSATPEEHLQKTEGLVLRKL